MTWKDQNTMEKKSILAAKGNDCSVHPCYSGASLA